jgi:hypothetical protein
MKTIMTIVVAAVLVAPAIANAAPRHYRAYSGSGGAGTAAAAHFQDHFKNTY